MSTLDVTPSGQAVLQGLQAAVARPQPRIALPALRDELRLLPSTANADGSPAWIIHDPVVNRFFRIGWLDFELLSRWHHREGDACIAAVNAETLLTADVDDVEGLLRFLAQHSLLKAAGPAAVDRLRQRAEALRRSPLEWMLHNYLFFRIPLIHPQQLLKGLLARLTWIYTRRTATVVVGATVLGLFLAARQWDTFATTFIDHLSWSGLAGYLVALSCAKALHELGHALTATRYGVRVAHMGVAFLVMFPMLYTDTSESWKLPRARQRLAIAGAGLVTELSLAGIATLGWSLAPDGPVRSSLFFLATTSWLLTLAVNASPFMRFDGYFITMDLLDFPNLHERAGAMARARMRRALLGWDVRDPEELPGRRNGMLALFAFATWAYRLTVFLGIALVVYHYFFKLLGIALMMVELVWFIARPIYSELGVWAAQRERIGPDRKGIALIAAAIAFMFLVVPWQSGVHGAGWLHAARQQVIYTPLAGRLAHLPAAGRVEAGGDLFVLAAPELQQAGQRAQGQADARAQELIGLAGLPSGEDRRAQVESQRAGFAAEARMYRSEEQRLALAAPFAGILTDIDPQLAEGVWVQPRQPLAVLIDPTAWVVEAFVPEEEVARIHAGQHARVHVTADGAGELDGRVVAVDGSRVTTLPDRMLDAQAGGPIVTLAAGAADKRADAMAPRDALYRVAIALDAPPHQTRMAVGRVVIDGDARGILSSAFEHAASVLVRESGF